MSRTPNRWVGLVFISMAISLVIIDGTIVNTIFPDIIKELFLSSSQVQWVQESYVLVFASMLLVWGSIADRFGRRRILLIGIAIFVFASIWAGLATNDVTLILARIEQGIGGAMVLPTTLALVNSNFQGKERGIAFAVWGSTIGGMVAIGPVLGGWLATDFNWRWAFFINIPLGIIILVGLLLFVKESKSEHVVGRIDYVGAAISMVMFSTLVFGLIEGRNFGWWNINTTRRFEIFGYKWPTEGISVVPIVLAVSLVAFIAFFMWTNKRVAEEKSVLLDFSLFKIASFRNGSIAALIISMGEFGLIFALPLWLQNIMGLDAVSSGLVLLWLAGGAFLASAVGGALNGKLSPVNAIRLGVLLEVIGVAGIAFFATTVNGWVGIAPFLAIYGVGVGFATAQLTSVIMVDIKDDKAGQASGMQSTVRQIGSALGIAVLGTTLFTAGHYSIQQRVVQLESLQQIGEGALPSFGDQIANIAIESSGAAIPELEQQLVGAGAPTETSTQIVEASRQGFTDGVKATGWAGAIFLLLGLATTFNLGSKSREIATFRKPRTRPTKAN
jgi:EmrB/QacA subfamily drug resistance transporter